MILLKNSIVSLSVRTLTLILALGIQELRATEGPAKEGLFSAVTSKLSSLFGSSKGEGQEDPKAVLLQKYPLTQGGMAALADAAFRNDDDVLLSELLIRYEQKQLCIPEEKYENFGRDCCDQFKEIADKSLECVWDSEKDFGKAARYYRMAEKFGDKTARENFNGLLEKLPSYGESRRTQLEKLTHVYLQVATADDAELLTKVAKIYKKGSDRHYGYAARCYLKISELGNPDGINRFHHLLLRFTKLSRDERFAEAKQCYQVCLQEMERDATVRTFLEINYSDPDFLGGVCQFYMEKGDADSVRAAITLYDKYKVASKIEPTRLRSLIHYYAERADDGYLEACHTVIEMSRGFGRFICYDTAVEYTIKAIELGDETAREVLHQLLGYIPLARMQPSTDEIERFFPLCLQEIESGDATLSRHIEGLYQHRQFLKGVLNYYVKKGDELSLQTAFDLYNRYKVVSQLEPSDLQALRKYYRPKADAGDLEACRMVIEMSRGFGKFPDYKTAVEYCIKAINLGDEGAREELYAFLETAGRNLSEQGISRFSQEWIDEQQDPRLFFLLGNAYTTERFNSDFQTASAYYFRAIALGDTESKVALSVPLEKLKRIGSNNLKHYVDKFVAQILPLYLREAERDPYFCRVLAKEYASGELVEKDIAKAVDLFIKAGKMDKQTAEAIHKEIVQTEKVDFATLKAIYEAEAQKEGSESLGFLLLAECYLPIDPATARKYFNKAISCGHVPSPIEYARMHAAGHVFLGGKVCLDLAAQWYLEAQKLGCSEARTELYALFDQVSSLPFLGRCDQFYALVICIDREAKATKDGHLFMALGNAFARTEFADVAQAAEYFFQAETCGDIRAREAFHGLVKTLAAVSGEQRIAQASKLREIYLREAELGKPVPHALFAELCDIEGAIDVAIQYYLKAARLGDGTAAQKAWDCYIKQNAEITQEDCLDAISTEVKEGNPHAAYLMGVADIINLDHQVENFVKAAQWGHPEAVGAAESCYVEARKNVNNSLGKIRQAFGPLLAYYIERAGMGDTTLNLKIAKMYEEVFGVDGDMSQAVAWYEKELIRLAEAARGNLMAYEIVKKLHEELKAKPFTLDQLFRLAKPIFDIELKYAEYGVASSKLYVGKAYKSGKGVPRDVKQAATWLLSIKAEEDKALFDLAQLIFYGLYVSAKIDGGELEQIFPLYLTEAEGGNPVAQFAVGVMLMEGRGVKLDGEAAFQWLEKARANKDLTPDCQRAATVRLGRLCRDGCGVPQDIERAFEFLKLAKFKKDVNEFFEYKYTPKGKEVYFSWVEFETTFDRFHETWTLPSVGNDPNQPQSVKETSLGLMLASIENSMSALTLIHAKNLIVRKPGCLITALTVKKAVPNFIEEFVIDHKTYYSVGKENCEQGGKVRNALTLFHSCESNVAKVLDTCQSSIRANEIELMRLYALASSNEEATQNYVRLDKAQSRLINQVRRLQGYQSAALGLRIYLKSASTRNDEFFAPGEFIFLGNNWSLSE